MKFAHLSRSFVLHIYASNINSLTLNINLIYWTHSSIIFRQDANKVITMGSQPSFSPNFIITAMIWLPYRNLRDQRKRMKLFSHLSLPHEDWIFFKIASIWAVKSKCINDSSCLVDPSTFRIIMEDSRKTKLMFKSCQLIRGILFLYLVCPVGPFPKINSEWSVKKLTSNWPFTSSFGE